MEFKPSKEIIFSYEAGKHLPTTLLIRNTGPTPCIFKFKASNPNKFSIKPSPGLVRQGDDLRVQVIVHRDIVQNLQNEEIQILYGVKDYSKTHNFSFALQNGSHKDQLNLTVMVNEKQSRVKQLEQEMGNYRPNPKPSSFSPSSSSNKKPSSILLLLVTAIVGLLLGYFSPISLF